MADFNLSAKEIKEYLTIHEISSLLIPGAVFVYGLNLIYAGIGNFTSNTISISTLVIFLLLSYGAGRFVQSIGDLIEVEIERYLGDLKVQKSEKNVEDRFAKIFKNHKKLCRGLASSLFVLLILSWVNKTIPVVSTYSFLIILAIS